MSARVERFVPPVILAVIASTLLIGVFGHADRFIGDPHGELPVKLWVLETFAREGVLGGQIDQIGFPYVGPLNNPDPVGTLVTAVLRPLIGRVWAYNLLVVGQVYLSMLAGWALARVFVSDALAATVGGVIFGFAPLVLGYAVSGAVTDILNMWPYPFAMVFTLRALQSKQTRRWVGWAIAAGAMASLGFVSCPYNFVVFAAMIFPILALAWPAWRHGLLPVGPELRPGLRRVAGVLAIVFVALVVFAGAHALHMRSLMQDPDSQMSSSAVSATRHTWPYRFLEPGNRDRYVATLADYLAVGKDALITRVAASQFYRVFAPGIVALGLAAVALRRVERRNTVWIWAATAVFCVAASTGPFLPLATSVYFVEPVNVAWLATQFLLPGGDLILEPFRYALAAALALGVVASLGAAIVAARFGRWTLYVLPFAILADLALVSPTPFPVQTARLTVPGVYTQLDTWLPPGPILELPYFDHGTDRFYREHFFNQLIHGRPIANEVMGFAPRFLRENQFTAKLLSIEKSTGLLKVSVSDETRIEADRAGLVAAGFVGIVLAPAGYASEDILSAVRRELSAFGQPIQQGERDIYVLKPRAP